MKPLCLSPWRTHTFGHNGAERARTSQLHYRAWLRFGQQPKSDLIGFAPSIFHADPIPWLCPSESACFSSPNASIA